MKKNRFYFTHDFNARNDSKLTRLLMKEGVSGIGIFWCIVEMLWENDGRLPLSEWDCIAFALRTDTERIATVLHDFDLFKNDGEWFWSESIFERLEQLKDRSKKAAESAKLRWNRPNDANAMRTHSDRNAINKIKGNKIKENNNNTLSSIIILEKHEFTDFIEANCDNLKKMKTPMNAKQAAELASIYGIQTVCDVLLAMNNKPDIAKKYSSVGQTARQWLKNRKPEPNAKQTFTDHAQQWLESIAQHRATQNRGN